MLNYKITLTEEEIETLKKALEIAYENRSYIFKESGRENIELKEEIKKIEALWKSFKEMPF